MPQRRFILPSHAYHTISVTRGREMLLDKREAAEAVLQAIEYERSAEHSFILAYAILPDHLHLLLVPREPQSVSTVMHNLKSFAAKAVNRALDRQGTVWQQSFYDRVIRSDSHLEATVEYIHRNPVEAGIAQCPEEFAWCSAHPTARTDVEKFLGE